MALGLRANLTIVDRELTNASTIVRGTASLITYLQEEFRQMQRHRSGRFRAMHPNTLIGGSVKGCLIDAQL